MSAAPAERPFVPDVDGVWFQLVVDDPAAGAPYGQYHREDDLVWAEFYAGGSLRSGRLVGHLQPDGSIKAAYCLLTATGDVVSGECLSIPELDARGNIRIADHFRRSDGSSGVTYIEQIPAPVREA
ncbi:hypothetical protein Kfla_2931 [Kribbella flavida DSM 17836]|uniref:Uncharacterized protein n=1 Tax=Kribbella flavida (strain DSM 17836 / JCM 10339 / NBRC 14399) TaxID=479435 RepID=D2Q1K7_KRIFD|nr:hypothetical protein [Kribbella flavida]ADB31996.1 hypothetical protein Kfla_2931 [Kribbella flavida DSM 17836]